LLPDGAALRCDFGSVHGELLEQRRLCRNRRSRHLRYDSGPVRRLHQHHRIVLLRAHHLQLRRLPRRCGLSRDRTLLWSCARVLAKLLVGCRMPGGPPLRLRFRTLCRVRQKRPLPARGLSVELHLRLSVSQKQQGQRPPRFSARMSSRNCRTLTSLM